jgi:ectoine hydroxylase-related dioxygenase (phytanoyl-CoA dioxygenase family)
VPPRLHPPFFATPSLDLDAPPLARVISPRLATPAQVESFRRDGYAVVDDLLSPAQLARLSRAYDVAFAERDFALPDKTFLAGDHSPQEANPARQYTQRVNAHSTNAVMREVVFEMGKVCGRLASEFSGHAAGYRLSVSQLLTKEAGLQGTAWHLDVPQWFFDSPVAMTMWLAVDEATVENGCLHFLSGSAPAVAAAGTPGGHHGARPAGSPYQNGRWPPDLRDMAHNELNKDGAFPELEGLAVAACPLRAGSAVFHNALGAHGAPPNLSGAPRRALLLAMIPDGHNGFNGQKSVIGADDIARIAVGDACDETFGAAGKESFTFPLLNRPAGATG